MSARTLVLLTVLALSALLAVQAMATVARPTRICDEPKYPGEGYFTSLSVKGVRCATGSKLARSYYSCRVRAGGRKGRCTQKVLGFSCTEKRNSIPTEINARVICRRGVQTITQAYGWPHQSLCWTSESPAICVSCIL